MLQPPLGGLGRLGRLLFHLKPKPSDMHAGSTCWGQFVAMLFCQLGRAQSLREICGGVAAREGKLKHLGLPAAPARSTLAYANEHRTWQLYPDGVSAIAGEVPAGGSQFTWEEEAEVPS